MGKTSSTVKNRYNSKAYEQIALRVKMGDKQAIKAHADSKGLSLNAYILELIQRDMADNDTIV